MGEKDTNTGGLFTRIMNGLASKNLKPGTVISLKEILSPSDLDKWNKHWATFGGRLSDYTQEGIMCEGKDSLRLKLNLVCYSSDGGAKK